MKTVDKNIMQSIVAVAALYIVGRFIGSYLFDNNWVFAQFTHLSIWYKLTWVLFGAGVAYLFLFRSSLVEQVASNKKSVTLAVLGLFVLFLLFRFDSFVFGGTNLLINRIAIAEAGVIRWYDAGSMTIVAALYNILLLLGTLSSDDTLYRLKLAAGVNSLTLFSFLSTMASAWGAIALTRIFCTDNKQNCWAIFLILFTGPQALLYFGYIGIEPVVVSFTIWIAYFIVLLGQQFSWRSLVLLWLLFFASILFWFPNIYLLPAVAFATISSFFRTKGQAVFAYATASVSLLVLLAVLYVTAGSDFWKSRLILFFSGTMPHSDYGLFSGRHLGDMLQSIWILFPQFTIVAILLWKRTIVFQGRAAGSLLFMAASGTMLIFIINPINSMPLDLLRLTAYLTPYGILVAYLIASSKSESRYSLSAILAAFALAIPVSLLPSYVSIDNSQAHVDEYTYTHDLFGMTTIHAYRDAYFYNENFDKANEWEWQLPKRSHDYLNYRGCQELIAGGKVSDALSVLSKVILQHPYWTEPRALLANVHMGAGRYQSAFPQIDTCIMAEPYNPSHYQMLYRCLRDTQAYREALTAISRAVELSPDEPDLLVDLMVINQFIGNLVVADSLADHILDLDSSQAFPYAMRGFIAESRGEDSLAMKNYERFIRMAPEDPESMKIRKRLNALVVKSRSNNP